MSAQAKREYLQAIYARYRQASRAEKHRMLDEGCRITGYHRKYVLRRLNGLGPSAPRRPRRRAATYGPAVIDALAAIWEAAGYPWSLRLKALLPLWLPWARKRFRFSAAVARQLTRRLYGRTKPGTLLKHHIPLKTDPSAGRIEFLGSRIDGQPVHRTVSHGLAHVLERRRLFPFLTVLDNVLLGAHNLRARPQRAETLARVETLFPVVRTRRAQLAHTLSGGEQQMVAIARGLMARPRLLMIDEPFLGLAPLVVREIGHLVRRIRDEESIGIVFIEQNVELALRLADRGYVLESGRTILSGPSAELLRSPDMKRIFLGDAAH